MQIHFIMMKRLLMRVLINFVIIGEAVSRLTEKFKQKENQIPWLKIKAFRNIVAHDYFGIDAE